MSGLRVNDDGSCIVGRCENEGTIRMRLISFGIESEANFCEGCAPHYRPCWKPVAPDPQLQMVLA